ncbi:hypothetical protein ASF65_17365 [Aureimonas sp. Leaf324]|nr:hypothetical protein ASF65_17365 [Aureimonas sp. Leaf324]
MRKQDNGLVMRVCVLLTFATLYAAVTALAAEETSAHPKLDELVSQGYKLEASGDLVMRRKLIPPVDIGIFGKGRTPSCIGAPIATMRDRIDTCQVERSWTDKAEFQRMVKGNVEFVCVLYGKSECYPVH